MGSTMKLALIALLALATPALADNNFGQPMFGYQAASPAPSYSTRSYGYRHRELPRREVTTITPTRNGGTRIETRRFYGRGSTATYRGPR